MYGPSIICRTLTSTRLADRNGNCWQYNSRSDHHTKVACWSVLFDALLHSPLLRRHAERGDICFALNRELRDFWTGQSKTVDCVLGVPELDASDPVAGASFRSLADKLGIRLDDREQELLEFLPDLPSRPVRSIHVAIQARACMTGHAAAGARLQRDLCATHAAIHGAAETAVAVGLVIVNAAEEFVSPDRNRKQPIGSTPVVTRHNQPRDAIRVRDCIVTVPSREDCEDAGYDALGLVALDARNDGTRVERAGGEFEGPESSEAGSIRYDAMVRRVAAAYERRFVTI